MKTALKAAWIIAVIGMVIDTIWFLSLSQNDIYRLAGTRGASPTIIFALWIFLCLLIPFVVWIITDSKEVKTEDKSKVNINKIAIIFIAIVCLVSVIHSGAFSYFQDLKSDISSQVSDNSEVLSDTEEIKNSLSDSSDEISELKNSLEYEISILKSDFESEISGVNDNILEIKEAITQNHEPPTKTDIFGNPIR